MQSMNKVLKEEDKKKKKFSCEFFKKEAVVESCKWKCGIISTLMELGVELGTFLHHSFTASFSPEILLKFTWHILVVILS